MNLRISLALVALAVGLTAAPLAAAPPTVGAVAGWATTPNLTPLGHSAVNVPLSGPGSNVFNSDLAFRGDWAIQGTYDGFVIHDIEKPSRPKIVTHYRECSPGSNAGNQGDVLVWEDLLVRAWNTPAPEGATCDGQPVATGFEGLHVFDISDPSDPDLLGSVRIAADTTPPGCGSHTATLVPDAANGNLYVYSSGSSGACTGIDIVRIPLANPGGATYLRREEAGRPCHDTAVILGDAMKAACAGHDGVTLFSLHEDDGGSIVDPVVLWSAELPGVTVGHSAAFTFDAKYLVFGHEPGGGAQARCQATSSVTDRSLFIFDVTTGRQAGSFVHPRPQTATENCTWHNYNVVPLKKKAGKPRYVLVSGNYQSGLSVVDFSDPANAHEIAHADPPPLSQTELILGGDWSTYMYKGRIYQSDIRRGLLVWRLDDARVGTPLKTPDFLNPQTQDFTVDYTRPAVKETPGSFELVGHDPLLNRGMNAAIAMHGDYAYIGSRTDGKNGNANNAGVLIVDVSDPTDPEIVHQMGPPLEGVTRESSRELRVWADQEILIVLHTNCGTGATHWCSPAGSPGGTTTPNNFRFYDISGEFATNPRLIGQLNHNTHEFFLWQDPFDKTRAFMFGGNASGQGWQIWNMTPLISGNLPTRIFNGNHGYTNPTGGLHSLSVTNDGKRAFFALLNGGFAITDVSDFTSGVPSPQYRQITTASTRPRWAGPGAHSAIKLFDRPWAYVSDEVYGTATAAGHGCPWGWARMIDIENPVLPAVVSEFKLPQNQQTQCAKWEPRPRTSYSAHNPTLTMNIAFTTWHSGGVQAISLDNPRIPYQLAQFFPKPLPEVQLEDPRLSEDPDTGNNEKVVMWSYPIVKDGLIYVVDLRNGLYVLRYTGPHQTEVDEITFLEGNSNIGHALCYELVLKPKASPTDPDEYLLPDYCGTVTGKPGGVDHEEPEGEAPPPGPPPGDGEHEMPPGH